MLRFVVLFHLVMVVSYFWPPAHVYIHVYTLHGFDNSVLLQQVSCSLFWKKNKLFFVFCIWNIPYMYLHLHHSYYTCIHSFYVIYTYCLHLMHTKPPGICKHYAECQHNYTCTALRSASCLNVLQQCSTNQARMQLNLAQHA